MQCTGAGDWPVLTWTITRASPVIASVRLDKRLRQHAQTPAFAIAAAVLVELCFVLSGVSCYLGVHPEWGRRPDSEGCANA